MPNIMYKFKALLISVLTVILFAGCSDELATKRALQAELLQLQVKSFAEACEGKLSMTMNLTGEMEKPATILMSCDDMKKTHTLFQVMNEKDIGALKDQIKELN